MEAALAQARAPLGRKGEIQAQRAAVEAAQAAVEMRRYVGIILFSECNSRPSHGKQADHCLADSFETGRVQIDGYWTRSNILTSLGRTVRYCEERTQT
jgi:hypothetical protein